MVQISYLSYFKCIKLLGSGGNGCVYLMQDIRTDEQVALKFMLCYECCFDEYDILLTVDHPNIVSVYDYYIVYRDTFKEYMVDSLKDDIDKSEYLLVLEFNYIDSIPIRDIKNISLQEVEVFMIKMISTLAYLHQHDIVHQDISMNNIMYKKNNPILIDFGCASVGKYFEKIDGHYRYLPPGYRDGYNTIELAKKRDIWSLGQVIYQLVTGKYLHKSNSDFDNDDLYFEYLNDFKPPLLNSGDEIIDEVVNNMLEINPDNRIDAETLCYLLIDEL